MKSTKALITLVGLFFVLTIIVISFPPTNFDLSVSHGLQSIDSPLFRKIMNFVSKVGDGPLIQILVGLTVASFIFIGQRIQAVVTLLLTISSVLTGSFLKVLINRPRPTSDQVMQYRELLDKSFPSLHVLVFTVFFGYLLYLALTSVKNTFIKTVLILISLFMIITIGFSRIYLGAHWASDTIGGYLLGFFFINLAVTYAKR